MLHKVTHDQPGTLWCGPAAISLLTGFPTSLIHRLVKNDREAGRAVKGMYPGETFRVLRQLGYSAAREFRPETRTVVAAFAAWLATHAEALPVLVMTETHYLVLHAGRFADSGSPDPVPVENAPADVRCMRVVSAWAVHKVAEPSIPPDTLAERKATIGKARSLARKHGIRIDREGERYWFVWCPELSDDDPFDGDGWCGTEADVLAKVERYAECLTTGYLDAVTDPRLWPKAA